MTPMALSLTGRRQVGTRIQLHPCNDFSKNSDHCCSLYHLLGRSLRGMLVAPLGVKQMALQCFGHLPCRSPFWVGWFLLPTAYPQDVGTGRWCFSSRGRRPHHLAWEQLCAEVWSPLSCSFSLWLSAELII